MQAFGQAQQGLDLAPSLEIVFPSVPLGSTRHSACLKGIVSQRTAVPSYRTQTQWFSVTCFLITNTMQRLITLALTLTKSLLEA